MDERQAFKSGFIARCLGAGLADPAAMTKLAEVATRRLSKQAGWIADAIKGVKGLGTTAMLAPPLLGAGLGYGAAKLTDIDDFDVEEAKRQEIIDEYRRQAQRLRQSGQLRQFAR